jgi:hypothetical protein
MVQKGKDLILSIDDEAIAAARSCDLDLQTDFIDVCAPNSGVWKESNPTTNSWGCSASALCTTMEYFDKLEQLWHDRTKITLRFWDKSMWCFYKGDAYIKSLKTSGKAGSLVELQATFQPTGELVKATKTVVDWSNDAQTFYNLILFRALTGRPYVYCQQKTSKYTYIVEVTVAKPTRFFLVNGAVLFKGTKNEALDLMDALDSAAFNAKVVGMSGAQTGIDGARNFVVEEGTYSLLTTIDMGYGQGTYYVTAI